MHIKLCLIFELEIVASYTILSDLHTEFEYASNFELFNRIDERDSWLS